MSNSSNDRPFGSSGIVVRPDSGRGAAAKAVGVLERLSRWAEQFGEVTAIVCVAVFTALVLAGVFYRYVLVQPLSWSEEVVRFTLVWMTFLGGSVALKRREHIAVDVVQRSISKRAPLVSALIGLFSHLAIAVFVWLLLVHGTNLVLLSVPQVTPTLRISQAWPYAGIPIGALLMLFHAVFFVGRELERLSNGAWQGYAAEEQR